MTYQVCLDRIFESFIRAKPLISHQFDRKVRDPHRLLQIAKGLDLLPAPSRVIKVTGSKGKGTTSRLIAELLKSEVPDQKIGLLISPEEIDHLDRMRLNGDAISTASFCDHAGHILDHLPPVMAPAYYSPYGLFLLIALSWFKAERVDHLVIECGRGVLWDEGGQLPGQLGVVSSIFEEHLDKLGPTLNDIRADKLSIAKSVQQMICAPQVSGQPIKNASGAVPGWFQACADLARQAVAAYVGHPVVHEVTPLTASFGRRPTRTGGAMLYEAMVSDQSADRIFWQKLKNTYGDRLQVYLSLSDDKKITEIETFFAALDIAVQHIILTGERGNLCYDATKDKSVFYTGGYDDVESFQSAFNITGDVFFAFVGTQTYVRLVKRAFFL